VPVACIVLRSDDMTLTPSCPASYLPGRGRGRVNFAILSEQIVPMGATPHLLRISRNVEATQIVLMTNAWQTLPELKNEVAIARVDRPRLGRETMERTAGVQPQWHCASKYLITITKIQYTSRAHGAVFVG